MLHQGFEIAFNNGDDIGETKMLAAVIGLGDSVRNVVRKGGEKGRSIKSKRFISSEPFLEPGVINTN